MLTHRQRGLSPSFCPGLLGLPFPTRDFVFLLALALGISLFLGWIIGHIFTFLVFGPPSRPWPTAILRTPVAAFNCLSTRGRQPARPTGGLRRQLPKLWAAESVRGPPLSGPSRLSLRLWLAFKTQIDAQPGSVEGEIPTEPRGINTPPGRKGWPRLRPYRLLLRPQFCGSRSLHGFMLKWRSQERAFTDCSQKASPTSIVGSDGFQPNSESKPLLE